MGISDAIFLSLCRVYQNGLTDFIQILHLYVPGFRLPGPKGYSVTASLSQQLSGFEYFLKTSFSGTFFSSFFCQNFRHLCITYSVLTLCTTFSPIFTSQPLRAVGVLISPMVSGWVGIQSVGGRRKKVFPGCFSETVKCRKLILGGALVRRCATSCSDLDLTFP